MIRTAVVKLNTIPALAYRQRLGAGDVGIVIVKPGVAQPGLASLSKNTGKPALSKNTSAVEFPPEAFEEAVAKTAGLPWKKLGVVKADPKQFAPEPAAEPEPEPVVVEEYVYKDLVDAFTDDSGKFSYALFNKSLIQLAHRSPVVKRMLAEGAGVAEIRDYVVGAKVRGITKNDRLSADEVAVIVDVLDELEPKGVLKELNAELRRMQAKAK